MEMWEEIGLLEERVKSEERETKSDVKRGDQNRKLESHRTGFHATKRPQRARSDKIRPQGATERQVTGETSSSSTSVWKPYRDGIQRISWLDHIPVSFRGFLFLFLIVFLGWLFDDERAIGETAEAHLDWLNLKMMGSI